jgi:hypothetical protein
MWSLSKSQLEVGVTIMIDITSCVTTRVLVASGFQRHSAFSSLPPLDPQHHTIMSGFDQNRVYSIAVHDNASKSAPDSASEVERRLLDFLLQYRVGGEFIYRYVMVPYGAF